MTNPAEKAMRMAAIMSEGLNAAAYCLLVQPTGDGAQRLALLRTSLNDIITLVDELDPTKVSGPNDFQLAKLGSAARELLERVASWDETPWPTPEPVMHAVTELLAATGLTEAQAAELISKAKQHR